MTEPRRALHPSDYTDGRPPELDDLFPWVGGTAAQQRGTINLRKKVWAEQDAATEAVRVAAFYAERDRREAAHHATKGPRDGLSHL